MDLSMKVQVLIMERHNHHSKKTEPEQGPLDWNCRHRYNE